MSCTEIGRTVEYSYDELERLTSETVTTGNDVSVTTYSYDSNSNRISMNRDGEVTNYDYYNLNQITQAGDVSYTWDNTGNLVSQSRNGVIAATYTYDCHNRMISADINNISGNIVESYTYDFLGNRTSKTTNGETTYFTTDLSTGYSQVMKAESSSETIYYTRGFELISRRAGQDAHYYLFDGGMSVRGLTDETGAITDTFVFDAFGNEVARTGSSENSYGFQGEEKDATGLYYLRARYMDPSTGTFTSMDTYAGSLSDPMSLHKYLFANSNPIKYRDPSGHFTLAEMDTAITIAAIMDGCELLAMLGTTASFGFQGKSFESQEFGYDMVKSYIGGALLGLVAGFCIAGVFAAILIPIISTVVAIGTIIVGMGVIMSEMCTVKIGFEINILGALFQNVSFGLYMSPDGDIKLAYPEYGSGFSTSNFNDHGITGYIEIYPGSETVDEVQVDSASWNAGGAFPVPGGTVGADILFDDNGLNGFGISAQIGDPIPEVHLGGSV